MIALLLLSLAQDPPTVLTLRGKALKEEGFDDPGSIAKGNKAGWSIYKGKYEVVDGRLRVSEQADDGHHPAMSFKLPMKDVVLQCRVKLGESKWVGLSLDSGARKDHIFRTMFNPRSASLRRMSGMGATTKGETVAETRTPFEAGRWYTLVVELLGREAVLQIPEAGITLAAENEGFDVEKDRFELISGGPNAEFDDLKIWEAAPNPAWAAIKAKLPPPPKK
jgi:hypothetical protein